MSRGPKQRPRRATVAAEVTEEQLGGSQKACIFLAKSVCTDGERGLTTRKKAGDTIMNFRQKTNYA